MALSRTGSCTVSMHVRQSFFVFTILLLIFFFQPYSARRLSSLCPKIACLITFVEDNNRDLETTLARKTTGLIAVIKQKLVTGFRNEAVRSFKTSRVK